MGTLKKLGLFASVALLVACGGGGGGGDTNGSPEALVLDDNIVFVVQKGDVIPLNSILHIDSAEMDGWSISSQNPSVAEISNGNLIAKLANKSVTLEAHGLKVGKYRAIQITVCENVYTGFAVPVLTHGNQRTTDNSVTTNNLDTGFMHATGTAVKTNTPMLFSNAATCRNTADSDIQTSLAVGVVVYPAKNILLNGVTYTPGQKITFPQAGTYTATFTLYNGTTKQVEITAYNAINPAIQQTPIVADVDTGETLWFQEYGTKPAKLSIITDQGKTLDITSLFYVDIHSSTGTAPYASRIVGVNNQEVDYTVPTVNNFRLDKGGYFSDVGKPFEYKVYGEYNGRTYDFTSIARLSIQSTDANFDYSHIQPSGVLTYNSPSRGTISAGPAQAIFDVGPATPETQKGRWQYVVSGETYWLGDYSSGSFTSIDNNTLKDNSNNTFLIRSGISSVQVTGSLASIEPLAEATLNNAKASTRSGGLSGIGGIDVILQNLNGGKTTTVQTDEDGNFTSQVETGDYLITSELITNNNGETQVIKVEATSSVAGTNTDLGQFTLTPIDDYNFKASLIATDITFFGASSGYYERSLRITNTGAKDISGARAKISFDNSSGILRTSSIRIGGAQAITDQEGYFLLGGIIASQDPYSINFKDITLRAGFTKPLVDTEIPVTIQIKDAQDRIWTDRITLPVSQYDPARVQIYSRLSNASGSVTGYIVTPGRTLIRLTNNSTDDVTYDLPLIPGNGYDIVFSNYGAATESAYSLAIGTNANVSELEAFNDVNQFEDDNSPENATNISYGESLMSYLLSNDIDFFRFEVAP